MGRIEGGIVVARLCVEYLAPVHYDGGPVRVETWVTEVKAASFVLCYAVRGRVDPRVMARAQTTMVPYDIGRGRPRRLTPAERDFLALWTDGKQAAPEPAASSAGGSAGA
jgi:acyl-CoA thioester hydrolase